MAIAIKHIDETDVEEFNQFLKSDRKKLYDLNLASLVPPHEDILVVAYKRDKNKLCDFADKYKYVESKYNNNIVSYSKSLPCKYVDNTYFIFSGYTFCDGKMYIGMDELYGEIKDLSRIDEAYGEFSLCKIDKGKIELKSDFFGMVPWFYYEDDEIFVASNNYHMMLLFMKEINIRLSMNIKRSRVNIITSGFTYGTSFTKDMDVNGCKMNLSYEKIIYEINRGVRSERTLLWNILSKKEEWNPDKYEDLINKAKDEIAINCKAAFEHSRFNRIVVDISGGFDSRVVFATACNLPKKLRNKMYTHTRKSGTKDDIEKANALSNIYSFPKYQYSKCDTTQLFDISGKINLDHISRNLGMYAVSSYLYTANYDNYDTLELTGYLGEVILGYMRCRGEIDYKLGDQRLLARLGGCYLWNSVEQLKEVFEDQKNIINETLDNYKTCDCLFKKFQQLYIDFRNRCICGSAHNVENNNMRIPMLFSKYALIAKWMYFNRFSNNEVPDEKISVDLISAINPLMAVMPFAESNNNVLPNKDNLITPIEVTILPDYSAEQAKENKKISNLYTEQVLRYMSDLSIAEQMLLHIYDYSDEYYSVCLGLYKVISEMKKEPAEANTGHARETIRKIYDIYYQIRIIE